VTARLAHANSFTLVATLAALAVCVRHAGVQLPQDAATAWLGRTPWLGLAVLLAVSGWLVAAAWERDRRPLVYAIRRIARIWPNLLVVVLASAYVLGPLATVLPVDAYLSDPAVAAYATRNLALQPVYGLPGVFQDVPYQGVVNGSLWSLAPQVACFALVPLVGSLPAKVRGSAWVALAGAMLVLMALGVLVHAVVWSTSIHASFVPASAFALGAAFRSLAVRPPAWAALGALGAFGLLQLVPAAPVREPLSVVLLAVAAIGLGLVDGPIARRLAPRRNLSLGIFLLGFPVQQTVVWWLPDLPAVPSLALALSLTILGAAVMERCIDRPVGRLLVATLPSRAPGRADDRTTEPSLARSGPEARDGVRELPS